MSNSANAALAGPWKYPWNGDLSLTDKIIAEDFIAHAAPITGAAFRGFSGGTTRPGHAGVLGILSVSGSRPGR